MTRKPRISVLLPLQDEREAGADCVRAWTGQDVDPECFELVALAPGDDHALESEVRGLLRPHDRWIVAPGRDEYELFNLGAEEGAGDFVFVTEAHCVPERNCLGCMLEELERTAAPGVRGASVPSAVGRLGELEREAFEDALRIEEDPGHWRKILIHSLALRRDLYLSAGGLPPSYGDFAPWPLAISLHQRGERLRFSPRPRVRHVYDGDLRQLESHVRSFGRGEMRYRSEVSEDVADRYLDPAVEWEQQLAHTRGGARRALRAGLALRHRGTLREMLRHLGVAVCGPGVSIARARLGAASAARRARRSPVRDEARRAFGRFWTLTSRRGRLEGLREARLGEGEGLALGTAIDFGRTVAGRAVGIFHPERGPDGGLVRWTGALALLKVDVAAPGRVRIGLMAFERPEGSPDPRPRVAVDDRVVEASVAERELSFEIGAGVHWIALACSTFRPSRAGADDPRALGLPIRSVALEPHPR